MGCEYPADPPLGVFALEIKVEEFYTQLYFTAHADFIENMLKISFHGPNRDPHLKGDLIVLVPHAR